jgi:GTP-binding protein HflX
LVFNKLDAIDREFQPVQLEDEFEIDGIQTPRIFVSALEMNAIPLLRKRLAQIVNERTDSPSEYPYTPDILGDDASLGTI